MKKKPRIDASGPSEGLTHNPFAAHFGRPEDAPAAEDTTADSGSTPDTLAPAKVVVRREKKGRAGKTVTRVSGLALAPDALDELARELKRALGCGASVSGSDVLLQGELTQRAADWLRRERGLAVVVGN